MRGAFRSSPASEKRPENGAFKLLRCRVAPVSRKA